MCATSITVTGDLEPGPAGASTGTVSFVPTAVMHDAAGNKLVTMEGVSATLTAGAFSVAVWANDDPTTNPEGTAYRVTHNGDPLGTFVIPYTAPGGTIDLADLAPATVTVNNSYASQASLNALAGSLPQFGVSGLYYGPGITNTSTITPTADLLYCSPVYMARATAIDQLAVNMVNNGTPAMFRLGVYDDTGDGYPGALRLDAGLIDCTASGNITVTVSATLQAGLSWIALVAQGGTGSTRNISQASLYMGSTGVLTSSVLAFTQAGVTTTLPDPFTPTPTNSTTAPRVWFRVA